MVDIVLGFDFGIKRIGIAMGNTLTGQAQPLDVIKAVDNATRFKVIGELIEQWRPARLVVGEPRHPDGAEHDMTLRARRFANQLHGRFGVAVALVDERGSSMQAQALLGTHADDDAMAAAVILQRYLDALPE